MSLDIINAVLSKSTTSGPQRLLLMILAHHANEKNDGICWPRYDLLNQEMGYDTKSVSNVKRLIGQLKATGEVLVSDGRGRGNRNYYMITLGKEPNEIRRLVDDYEKNGISFDTFYWEKELKKVSVLDEKVSEVTPYNEEKGINPEEKGTETDTIKSVKGINFERKGIKTDTSMLTKRTKRKEELKGELKEPPLASQPKKNGWGGNGSEPIKEPHKRDGEVSLSNYTDPEVLANALAKLCKIDPEMASPKQEGDIKAAVTRLYARNTTEHELENQFRRWWYSFDWRGKKGEPPTPMQVCEMWERFRGAKLNGTPLGQLTNDKLAAYKALRAQEE